MNAPAYQVRLENIFEGPMDLLVHLIKKNEVDICDIPIALITDQFLSYIQWMQDMEIDVAADFLVMASTLTQIKSRMLLPETRADSEEDEDPRDAIAGPLMEYIRMKSAAHQLESRSVLNRDVFARPGGIREHKGFPEQIPVEADLYELVALYQDLMERSAPDAGIDISPEKISVKEKIAGIMTLLETRKTITFDELAAPCESRGEVIAVFLAILEIARLNMVEISQDQNSGGLRLDSR